VRRAENVQLANHAEIATDFIPLSSMTAVSLQDGGQIVRVKLPRSALANFGLPVNMDRYNEKVKADVLIGVDGLAHAIRFVQ
jgi:flavin-dependent dehydrogenase